MIWLTCCRCYASALHTSVDRDEEKVEEEEGKDDDFAQTEDRKIDIFIIYQVKNEGIQRMTGRCGH